MRAAYWLKRLALLSLLVSGCGNEITDTQYLQRARQHYAQGELQASAIELQNALRQNSANSEARQLLGEIYIRLGNGAVAEKVLMPILTARQPAGGALTDLGKALLLQGKYREVLERIQIMDDFAIPDQAQLHAVRGEAYLGLEEMDAAREEFRSTLRLQPDAETALIGLTRLAGALGQLAEMQELLGKLLAKAPDSSQAWSLQGDYYRYKKDLDKAEEAYTKAIASSPYNKVDYLSRAWVRTDKRDVKGAAADVDIYIKWFPDSPDGYFIRGILALQEGRYEDAYVFLTEVLNRNPDYMPAIFYLGQVSFAQKKYEQAQKYLNTYLWHDPDSSETMKKLAIIYINQKDYQKAQAVLEQPALFDSLSG